MDHAALSTMHRVIEHGVESVASAFDVNVSRGTYLDGKTDPDKRRYSKGTFSVAEMHLDGTILFFQSCKKNRKQGVVRKDICSGGWECWRIW